jgi:outer membrane lipoprotein-sorting protein
MENSNVKQTIRTMMILGTFAALAAGQDPAKKSADLTDPIEILKKADAACKAVDFIQYTASVSGEGAAKSLVPNASGTVVLKDWGKSGPAQYRFEAKIERPGSSDVTEITVGSDGKSYFLINTKEKKVYEDIDQAVVGTAGRSVGLLTMAEYVHPEPFSDEIKGTRQELKGSTKVGDEDCYEIHVTYAEAGQEATWFFSKKDFLPRRVDRFRKMPTGEKGSSQLIVTKLTVDPKIDKDPFKLIVPEGFTKIDDFAP